MTETSLPHTPETDCFSLPAAPWVMLACLPKFGVRRRQAVREVTSELTGLLDLNPATLRAMGPATGTGGGGSGLAKPGPAASGSGPGGRYSD